MQPLLRRSLAPLGAVFLLLALVLPGTGGAAEIAVLTGDINRAADIGSTGGGTVVGPPVAVGGVTYFAADDGVHGTELWRTEGTPATTRLVRDIFAGQSSSHPSALTAYEGHLYFAAADLYGCGLWRSDGTPQGTEVVRTFLRFESCGVFGRPRGPSSLAAVGSMLLFAADDGITGIELWRSDGTAAGTRQVRNINTNHEHSEEEGSRPRAITSLGTRAIFAATTGTTLTPELWVTDGSEQGTRLLADLSPLDLFDDRPWPTLGGTALFAAAVDGQRLELWRSDGTEAGTFSLLELAQSPLFAFWWNHPAVLGQAAFFLAPRDSQAPRLGLWRTDGTVAGTAPVALDLPDSSSGSDRRSELVATPTQLFFALAPIMRLWASDGTAAGTRRVASIQPEPPAAPEARQLYPFGDGVAFAASDPVHGCELWTSDGTAGGTALVDALNPNLEPCYFAFPPGNVLPRPQAEVGPRLLFSQIGDRHGVEPYVTDGTPAGTELLADINAADARTADADPRWLTPRADAVLFAAFDDATNGLFVSHGRPADAQRLADLGSGTVADVASIRDVALFLVNVLGGPQLWRSDGTTGGTRRLTSFTQPASFLTASSDAAYIVVQEQFDRANLWRTDASEAGTSPYTSLAAQEVFAAAPLGPLTIFAARTANEGAELWRTDGTAAGTFLLRDINPGEPSALDRFTGFAPVLGNRRLFFADDGRRGRELWSTDGSSGGTDFVANLTPGAAGSTPGASVVAGGRVYFAATTAEGAGLWVTDGSGGGTGRLADLDVRGLAVAGATVFAIADDGRTGAELWRIDGDDVQLVVDLRPGPEGALGDYLATPLSPLGSRVIFIADDGTSGREVWSSDGTASGTVRLTHGDPRPSVPDDPYPSFTRLGDRLAFSAFTPEHGSEPWITDGTSFGTQRMADIAPGPLSSQPSVDHRQMVAVGQRLFLAAQDGRTGFELWSIGESSTVCAGDCGGDGSVTIDELIRAVGIALGGPVSACPAGDVNGDGLVLIEELVSAVRRALDGCAGSVRVDDP